MQEIYGRIPLSDSKRRNCLARLNQRMGFPPHHFIFQCLGATLAKNAHIPMQHIHRHGSWMWDCVWIYIKQDWAFGEEIADSLGLALVNA